MAEAPLRVVSLSTRYPNPARPGYGNFIERQNVALAARPGVELQVVAPIGLPPFPLWLRHPALRAVPREEVRRGLSVHHPRYVYWPSLAAHTPARIARALLPLFRRIGADFPFDLIHAESFWPEGPAACRLARALGVPFSIKARGRDVEMFGERPALRRLMVEAAEAAAGLLAMSASLRESLARMGVPADGVAVHYPGVDRNLFSPGDRGNATAATGFAGPVLLCVGNLTADKGQGLALEALARLDAGTLVLAGAGPEADPIRKRADALGLRGRLKMPGSVPHSLLPAFYRAADVMLHLPRREGIGNVRLEALACGTPVVTTEAGDAAILLDRPEAGLIVPADAAAVAAAVRRILDCPPPREAVRAATDRFSWERNAEELERHLTNAARAVRRN